MHSPEFCRHVCGIESDRGVVLSEFGVCTEMGEAFGCDDWELWCRGKW